MRNKGVFPDGGGQGLISEVVYSVYKKDEWKTYGIGTLSAIFTWACVCVCLLWLRSAIRGTTSGPY